jgi:hypothetical protein
MQRIFIKATITILCFQSWNALAQTDDPSPAIWFMTNLNVEVKNNWSIGNELHFRRANFLKSGDQLILRPYASYKLKERMSIGSGYSFIKNYQNRVRSQGIKEHNIWEQIVLRESDSKHKFSFRFRLEHRFEEKSTAIAENHNFKFSNRFRYQFGLQQKISRKAYVRFMEELWIRMNSGFGHSDFDRNWLSLGVGHEINRQGKIEMTLLQVINHPEENHYEKHPVLQLSLTQGLLSKK